MKIKILDPNGVHFGGKIVPQGSTLEISPGPHTTAWFRFGQAEQVKEEPEAPADSAKAPAKAKSDTKKS